MGKQGVQGYNWATERLDGYDLIWSPNHIQPPLPCAVMESRHDGCDVGGERRGLRTFECPNDKEFPVYHSLLRYHSEWRQPT